MSAGAKRKLKKLKMQGDEAQQIVDQLLGLCMAHNISVQFPWELPNIVGQILASHATGSMSVPGQAQAVEVANESIERLRQLTHGGPPPSPRPQAARDPERDPWSTVTDEEPQRDPWEMAAEAALDGQDEDLEDEPSTPEEDSYAQMVAQYEEGQARLLNRVATEGVKYKNGAQGPAAGKKIAPAPGVLPASATESVPAVSSERAPNGEKRGMNGLTASEARELITRVTGKVIEPPKGNPFPKPPM